MLTRRGMLPGAGATGASIVAGRPAGAAPSTVKTPVDECWRSGSFAPLRKIALIPFNDLFR